MFETNASHGLVLVDSVAVLNTWMIGNYHRRVMGL